MSLTRTGPLTLRMIDRDVSSMNSTRTWVTPPREPVRPRTCCNKDLRRRRVRGYKVRLKKEGGGNIVSTVLD